MNKIPFYKKIGVQTIFIALVAMLISSVLILVIALTRFRAYNNNILIQRAYVGMEVLENDLESETKDLEDNYWMWTEDRDFENAVRLNQPEVLERSFKDEYKEREGHFCLVGDNKGNIIYKSENYPLNIDVAAVAGGTIYNGILKNNNTLAAVYAAPYTGRESSGVLIMGFDLKDDSWMDNVKKQTECDVSVFYDNTRFATTVANPSGGKATGTTMGDDVKAKVIDSSSPYEGLHDVMGKPYFVSYEPIKDVNGSTVGAYFAGYDAEEANAEFLTNELIAIAIGIVCLLIAGVVMFIYVNSKINKPISEASKLADEMASGQFSSTDVNYEFDNNEVGNFAKELIKAKGDLSGCIADVSRILSSMAEGDFTGRTAVTYVGDFVAIENNMMKIEDDLGETLSKMNMSSEEVLTGSNQMAEGSQSLADGTTRQASAIEEISATIAEVSTQISNTAQNAAQAGDLSKQTQDKVNMQDAEIQNMVQAMNDISSTSKEIEKIIKTIEDIAFQTNILALNAAVEAARAGDAGKGFAVVADEVRNLASKSAEAASSTTSLITASIDAVGKGSKIAFATAESMKEVKNMSTQTAELITQIAAASAEQTESIRQITTGVEQISQVIQTNSATAEETAASCEELSGQARLLKDQVARFRINQ